MPLPVSICTVLIGAVLFLSPLVASSREEPAWNSFYIAAVALAAGLVLWRESRAASQSRLPATLPHAALFGAAGLGFLSFLWHWLVTDRGTPIYLDVMLQGWAYIAALAGIAWAATGASANRAARYALLLCLVASAGIAGVYGLQDWLIHAKEHAADWREFSTTTDPDFFAGFLVMTIPATLALYLGAPNDTAKDWGLIRFVVVLLIAYALTLPILYGILAITSFGGAIAIALFLVVLAGLALLIRAIPVAPFLLGLSLVWQLAALVTTGSRFALISLAIGFIVMAALHSIARRAGMPLAPRAKPRILILAVLALLGGIVVARPIVHRLAGGTLQAQAHSGDFRIWTWKGAAHLAASHPILGTGPGTFVYTYPRYALVGFTQLAHDSYIQIADDIGVPALLLVLAAFAGIVALGLRAIITPAPAEIEPPATAVGSAPKSKRARQQAAPPPVRQSQADMFLSQAAVPDDRLLLAGLLGGFIAGLIQNLIDSDLYLLYNGVALFTLAGAILAYHPMQAWGRARTLRAAFITVAVVYLAVFLGMIWSGVAELYALSGDYQTAAHMVPWSAEYAGGLGWQTYPEAGLSSKAGEELTLAATLEPDVKDENRLGQFDLQQGLLAKALTAFQDGLRTNPNDPELLLNAAQTAEKLGNKSEALAYYRDLAALEHGPVGLVPAVPEAVQYRYAIADSAVADEEFAQGDLAGAARDYQAAQRVLEAYANGNGSRSPYQEVGNGGAPNPALDQSLEELYSHVITQLQQIDQRTGKSAQAAVLRARATRFQAKFAAIIAGK